MLCSEALQTDICSHCLFRKGAAEQTENPREVPRAKPRGLPQEVHEHPGNRGTLHTQQLMKSSLHLPVHPGGGGTSDLATRNHAELSLEEAAFFLLQGRHSYITEEQDCYMRRMRIALLTGHSPRIPEWGQGADSNRPSRVKVVNQDRGPSREEQQEEIGPAVGLETYYLQHQPEVHSGGRAEAGLEIMQTTTYTCSSPAKKSSSEPGHEEVTSSTLLASYRPGLGPPV